MVQTLALLFMAYVARTSFSFRAMPSPHLLATRVNDLLTRQTSVKAKLRTHTSAAELASSKVKPRTLNIKPQSPILHANSTRNTLRLLRLLDLSDIELPQTARGIPQVVHMRHRGLHHRCSVHRLPSTLLQIACKGQPSTDRRDSSKFGPASLWSI